MIWSILSATALVNTLTLLLVVRLKGRRRFAVAYTVTAAGAASLLAAAVRARAWELVAMALPWLVVGAGGCGVCTW